MNQPPVQPCRLVRPPTRSVRWPAIAALALLPAVLAGVEPQDIAWDTFPDTWVAADGLGRSLPTHEQVGPPRSNKTVVLF